MPSAPLPPVAASVPAADPVVIAVHPDQPKQVIKGIGFEIQSDSIGSGNHGLPDDKASVPHDLVPAERERLAKEMLKGFRYCRLAGGLYWRGLDAENKHLLPRWPEQLQEVKQLLDAAGIEGLFFEYWSPAPFWKSNRSFSGGILRCFGADFAEDPDYRGEKVQFLKDFARAVVADIKTLQTAGLKIMMWGLQNEPDTGHITYSTCIYDRPEDYIQAYTAVAGAVRAFDPDILLFSDTAGVYPSKIAPAMQDPVVASLVDAYAVHIVGSGSDVPESVFKKISETLPKRPWFQNEYEYLDGDSTPERCLNTVHHIMNSFQRAECPTWFWIHCLKPVTNAEASGYSLGFWKSPVPSAPVPSAEAFRRWVGGPEFTSLPDQLKAYELVSVTWKDPQQAAIGYKCWVNQPVIAWLVVEDVGGLTLDPEWQPTGLTSTWNGRKDRIFKRPFPKGSVVIPAATAAGGDHHAAPHTVFIEATDAATFRLFIDHGLPMQIRSQALAIERRSSAIKPGHWVTNPYNWHAVGSFVRHMPWDCTAIAITEGVYNSNARIFTFKRPDQKLTVVLSNGSAASRSFAIATRLGGASWKGFRYTPEEAGSNTMGVAIGDAAGAELKPTLPPMSWEFWEQQ